MTTIFVSSTKEDAECAVQVRTGLEAKGYTVWREPPTLDPSSPTYPRVIETAILGSGAMILVWSKDAAASPEVGRLILFAQQLQKQVVSVVIDSSNLPSTLTSVEHCTSQAPYTDVMPQLLPLLPTPNSKDALIVLSEQAANTAIGRRKEALRAATAMLQRDEQRAAILAVLEYLARHDITAGVREEAQSILDREQKKVFQQPVDINPLYRIGVRCRNGHVSYFDGRAICQTEEETIVRNVQQTDNQKLDQVTGLKCQQCGDILTVYIDCGKYR